MGIKSFFKKIGEGTKNFFKKGGIADTGLKKAGDFLTKAGGVGSALAPLAMVVAPEIAAPLMAGSALAGIAGKTAQGIRSGAQKGGNIVEKTQNIVGATKGGLEAAMPIAAGLGANFA
jgi:hypothetical protein